MKAAARPVRMLIFLAAIAGPLSACVTAEQRINHREGDLAAAGFIVKPANTPERQEMLGRLPPNRFVQRSHEDEVTYVYADPVVCKCLYIGSQQAYGAFKKHEQDQHLVDEQRLSAEMYSDAAWQWEAWGPWGPGIRMDFGPRGW